MYQAGEAGGAAAASSTNGTRQWTVTFTESVTGVTAGDFALAASGLGGTPTVTDVSGSGATWTVTASTGSGSGTLGLNLVDDDSIADAAGNKLGGAGTGNGNATGATYSLNRIIASVALVNGTGTAGTIDSNDQIVIRFSRAMNPNTICGSWTQAGSTLVDANSATGGTKVTVALDGSGFGGGSGNDTLTLTSSNCVGSLRFGTINLASPGYVNGLRNFALVADDLRPGQLHAHDQARPLRQRVVDRQRDLSGADLHRRRRHHRQQRRGGQQLPVRSSAPRCGSDLALSGEEHLGLGDVGGEVDERARLVGDLPLHEEIGVILGQRARHAPYIPRSRPGYEHSFQPLRRLRNFSILWRLSSLSNRSDWAAISKVDVAGRWSRRASLVSSRARQERVAISAAMARAASRSASGSSTASTRPAERAASASRVSPEVEHPAGLGHPHQLGQAPVGPGAGQDPEVQLGLGEPGPGGGDPEVAGHGQLAAAAQGRPVDGGDGRPPVGLEPLEEPDVDAHEGVVGVAGDEFADVGAGDEHPRRGRVEDQDGPLPGVVGEDLVESLGGGQVDGVALVGPVEADQEGVTAPFHRQRPSGIRHGRGQVPLAGPGLLELLDFEPRLELARRMARTQAFQRITAESSPGGRMAAAAAKRSMASQ